MEMDEMAGQVQALRDELDAARATLASHGLTSSVHARPAQTTSTSSGGSIRGERAEISQLRAQIASLEAQLGKGSDSKGGNGGKYGTRSRAGHGPGSGQGQGVTAGQEEGAVPSEQHQQLYATYTQTMEGEHTQPPVAPVGPGPCSAAGSEVPHACAPRLPSSSPPSSPFPVAALAMQTEHRIMLLNLLSRIQAECGKSIPPALGMEVRMALQSQGGSLLTGGGAGIGGGGLQYGGLQPLVPASVTGDGFMMASGQYLSHLPGATPGGSGRTTPDRGQGGHSTGPSQGQGSGRSSSTGGRGEQQDTSMLPMMLGYSHPYGTGGSDFGGSAGGPPVLPLPSLTMGTGSGTGTAPAAYIPMAAAGTVSSTSPQEVRPPDIRSLLDTATKDIPAFAADDWPAYPWPDAVLQQYGQQTEGKRASPGSAAGQPQTVPDPILQLEWQVPLPSARAAATVSMRMYHLPIDQPVLSTKWTARVMGVTCEQMALALWDAHTEQGPARLFSTPANGRSDGQLTCSKVDTLDDKEPTFGTVVEMTHTALEHAVRTCDSASPSVTLYTCCGVRRMDAVPCSLLATCLDTATALPPLTEVDGEEAGYGNARTGEIGVEGHDSDPLLWVGILRSADDGAEGDASDTGTGEGRGSEQGGEKDGRRECRVYGGWIIKRSKVGSREGCVVIYLEQLEASLGASAAAVHSVYMAQWPARVTALVTLAGSKGEQEAMQAAAGTTSVERILSSSPGRAGEPSMPVLPPGAPPFAMPMPMPMPVAYATAFGGVLMQSVTPRTQGRGMGGMSEHLLVTPPGGSLARMGGEHEDRYARAGGRGSSASTARHRASPSHAGSNRARTSSMASRDGGGDLSGPLPVRGMTMDVASRQSGRTSSRARGQAEQEGDNVSGSNLSGLDMLVQFLGPNGRGS